MPEHPVRPSVELGEARNAKLYLPTREARFLVGDTWYDVSLGDGALAELVAALRRDAEKRKRVRELDFSRLRDERDAALALVADALGVTTSLAYRLARLNLERLNAERDNA